MLDQCFWLLLLPLLRYLSFSNRFNLNHKLYIKLKVGHHDGCDWLVKSCYEAPSRVFPIFFKYLSVLKLDITRKQWL